MVRFVHDGAVVYLPENSGAEWLRVADADGAPAVEVSLADVAARRIHDFFTWQPEEHYRFALVGPRGTGVCEATAPAEIPVGDAVLEVPTTCRTDLAERNGPVEPPEWGMVPASSDLQAQVLLANYLTAPLEATVTVTMPEGFDARDPGPSWSLEGRQLRCRKSLGAGGQILALPFALRSGATSGTKEFALEVELMSSRGAPSERQTIQRTVTVVVGSGPSLSEQVSIVRTVMPTDSQGQTDVRQRPMSLSLPSTAGRTLRRLFGLEARYRDYYAPYAYQTIYLENRSAGPVSVAVRLRVTQPGSERTADGFRPPGYRSSVTGGIEAAVMVGAKRTEPIVLPVYLSDDDVLGGRYDRRIEVALLGTDRVVARSVEPLIVIRQNVRALAVTAVVCVVALVAGAIFLAAHRRVFARFAMRDLVLIALFASLSFAGAVFPGSILGPVFQAFTGPFAFLVQGIFFEVVYIALLTALVALVPRPGTVTLASCVRYLLGGIMLGGFTPVDLFYFASAVLLLELFLAAAGVTTDRTNRVGTWSKLVRAVLAVALANALSKYVIFQLNISFYRLFFADWFVWLNVLTAGLLYGGIGAFLGWRLGAGLRRVSG